jgi:hypothetical protein
LALALVLAAGAAHGEELQPLQGRSLSIGPLTGVAYYVRTAAGYEVVATVAAGEAGTPVRVSVTLLTGQELEISVPNGVGEEATALRIARVADTLTVEGPDELALRAALVRDQ